MPSHAASTDKGSQRFQIRETPRDEGLDLAEHQAKPGKTVRDIAGTPTKHIIHQVGLIDQGNESKGRNRNRARLQSANPAYARIRAKVAGVDSNSRLDVDRFGQTMIGSDS